MVIREQLPDGETIMRNYGPDVESRLAEYGIGHPDHLADAHAKSWAWHCAGEWVRRSGPQPLFRFRWFAHDGETGEGCGATVDEAKRAATADMIERFPDRRPKRPVAPVVERSRQ